MQNHRPENKESMNGKASLLNSEQLTEGTGYGSRPQPNLRTAARSEWPLRVFQALPNTSTNPNSPHSSCSVKMSTQHRRALWQQRHNRAPAYQQGTVATGMGHPPSHAPKAFRSQAPTKLTTVRYLFFWILHPRKVGNHAYKRANVLTSQFTCRSHAVLQMHTPCRYPRWIFGHLLGLHLLPQGCAPSFTAFCWSISIPPKIPTCIILSAGPRLHVCSSISWLHDYVQAELLVHFTNVLHRTHSVSSIILTTTMQHIYLQTEVQHISLQLLLNESLATSLKHSLQRFVQVPPLFPHSPFFNWRFAFRPSNEDWDVAPSCSILPKQHSQPS